MVSVAPEHCPSCGAELRALDSPGAYRCEPCEDYVFHNPDPNARVAVLDRDRVLLVEIADHARLTDPPHDEEWMLPGGHVELGEQPDEAAARELAEETGLAVAPGDLELFVAVCRQVVEGAHSLVLLYAVPASGADGGLAAATDASDARFWDPDELARSEQSFRDMHYEPGEHGDLAWLVGRARAALAGDE
jgi:ADP-ribose pyrophosphatase YjhB (NUDIX family)